MRDPDRGFDEEIHTHLSLLAERFIRQGMTPEEAAYAARRQFGNQSLLKEARKDMSAFVWLETLWQDVRFGARSLRRSPGVTAVILLTLMLGIGANAALFSVVYAVLLKPLPYREPDRLVFMAERNLIDAIVAADFLHWRREARSFESMAAFQVAGRALLENGVGVQVPIVILSESPGRILGVQPALGRDFLPEEVGPAAGASRDADKVALLSDRFFRQRFGGDPAALGKTLVLDNLPFVVIGVLPPDFRFNPPGYRGDQSEADVIENMRFDPAQLKRGGFPVQVLGRLKAGVKLETARAEIETIRAGLANPAARSKTPLLTEPLNEHLVGKTRLALIVLWAAVGFVLLVACINVANLLLARAAARGRETSIRAALGAGRARLMRQFLVESILLAFAGGAAGLIFARWAIGLIVQRSPADIPLLKDATLNWNVLLFSLAVCVLTGILSGLAPALAGLRGDPGDALKEGGRGGSPSRGRRLHGLLVVSELALALALLTGAGLMAKGLWIIRSQTAVFAPERVLTTFVNARRIPSLEDRARYFEELADRLEALPGVRAAATQGCGAVPFHIAGLPAPPAGVMLWTPCVSAHYLTTAGLRLISGRWFGEQDGPGAPMVTVVNEATARIFAKLYPDAGSILGRRIDDGRPPAEFPTVIGVVSDFRPRPDAEPDPMAYVPAAQDPLHGLGNLLVRASSDPAALADSIRRVVLRAPGVSMNRMQTLEEQMSAAVAPRRFQSALLAALAALALLLAMVGAYGVLSYAVTERTHEIGVRMALGAGNGDVLRMVLGRAGRLVAAGIAGGLLASAALTRWMRNLLYGVTPYDPWTYATVCLLLIAVAVAAAYLPARRAIRVDPMIALRYE